MNVTLRVCDAPDCETLTLGVLCIQHEPLEAGPFPRGRPFRKPVDRDDSQAIVGGPEHVLVEAGRAGKAPSE
jgi:hypothetical protein